MDPIPSAVDKEELQPSNTSEDAYEIASNGLW